MLVLSRKENEKFLVYLNGTLLGEIVIGAIGRSKVKIGFDMTPEVLILREELRNKDEKEPAIAFEK